MTKQPAPIEEITPHAKPESEWERWNYSQKGAIHTQALLVVENWRETLEKRPEKGGNK